MTSVTVDQQFIGKVPYAVQCKVGGRVHCDVHWVVHCAVHCKVRGRVVVNQQK